MPEGEGKPGFAPNIAQRLHFETRPLGPPYSDAGQAREADHAYETGAGFQKAVELHSRDVADQAQRSASMLSRARSRRRLSRLGALLLTLGLSTAFACAVAFAYAWSGWLGVATVAGCALSILGAGILDSTRKQTERERYDWQRVEAVRRNATPK